MEKASIVADSEARRVFKNSLYLLFIHLGNYIIPLIVIFYLVKILGAESFGVYAICTAIAAYVQVAIDYGFALTGCRAVAQNREDKTYVSNVFWEILYSKILIASLALLICFMCFNLLELDLKLYLSAVFSAIFTSLTPFWFFQGLESFRGVSFLSVTGKAFSCIPVLAFVESGDDLYIVFYSQATFSLLVMLAIYLYIYRKEFVLRVPLLSLEIKKRLLEGWHIFSATLSSVIVTNGGTLWLGAFFPSSVVGVYASVERLVKAVTSIFVPLGQAIYPINSRAFAEGISNGLRSAIRTGIFFGIIGVAAAIAFLASYSLFRNYFGYPPESHIYFLLFAFWIIVGVVNNILGAQILTAGGHSHVYAKCFHAAAIVFIFSAYFLIGAYAGKGAVYSLLIAEVSLSALLLTSVIFIFREAKLK